MGEIPTTADTKSGLRLFRARSPAIALGLAVDHLMTKPAFAVLGFGDWARILVGQINRGHYYFAVTETGKIVGFLGWALTSEAKAEAWLLGSAPLAFEDAGAGDCIVFNAWTASTREANNFLLHAARQVASGKSLVYYKRHYPDGRVRPVRLQVNEFVTSPVEYARH